jgi:hypothetical protein
MMTPVCASFEEKYELVLMTFPRDVTKFHGKMNVMIILQLAIHILW